MTVQLLTCSSGTQPPNAREASQLPSLDTADLREAKALLDELA
jgi:hypothetical protein